MFASRCRSMCVWSCVVDVRATFSVLMVRLCASVALCMMCSTSFMLLLIAEGSLSTKDRYTRLRSRLPYALRPLDWGVRLLAQKGEAAKLEIWNEGAR